MCKSVLQKNSMPGNKAIFTYMYMYVHIQNCNNERD